MKRSQAAIGLVATIALGLASRRVHLGVHVWDKSLGDALYTVMLYFLAGLVSPRWRRRPLALGAIAVGASIAIEVFQLTGIPMRLPRLLQLALGTAFAWHDVACYVLGGGAAVLVHVLVRRRAQDRARGEVGGSRPHV